MKTPRAATLNTLLPGATLWPVVSNGSVMAPFGSQGSVRQVVSHSSWGDVKCALPCSGWVV